MRQAEEKPRRRKKRSKVEQPMNPGEFPVNASVMTILPPGPSNMQMDPTMPRAPEHHYTMLPDMPDIAGVGGAYSDILSAPPTVRKSPDEEEMEDGEDSPEWAVRIGDAPPPSWGKRKASDDDEKDVNKKGRFHR